MRVTKLVSRQILARHLERLGCHHMQPVAHRSTRIAERYDLAGVGLRKYIALRVAPRYVLSLGRSHMCEGVLPLPLPCVPRRSPVALLLLTPHLVSPLFPCFVSLSSFRGFPLPSRLLFRSSHDRTIAHPQGAPASLR